MKPLEAMAHRLGAAHRMPPSITAIADLFADTENIQAFVRLIKVFLPEHEKDIMSQQGSDGRISRFCHYFTPKYFELAEYDWSDGYGMFVQQIPIYVSGLEEESYEEFTDWRPAWIAMAALVVYPFWVNPGDNGASHRVALVQGALDVAGESVKRIPPEGFQPKFLHEKLDNTKFAGVAIFADWLTADTGCSLMDCNDTSLCEGGGPSWNKDEVEALTAAYPQREELQVKINEAEEYLTGGKAGGGGADVYMEGAKDEPANPTLKTRFAELMNILVPSVPKEQAPLPIDLSDEIPKCHIGRMGALRHKLVEKKK